MDERPPARSGHRYEGEGGDDDFDRRLRQQLASEALPADAAEATLVHLRPRLARARLVRRAQVAAAAVVPLMALVGAVTVLGDLGPVGDGGATVAGQPDDASIDDDVTDPRPTLAVTGTTSGDALPPDGRSGSAEPEPADRPDDDPPTTSAPGPTSVPSRPTAEPTTSGPSTTSDPVGSGSSVPGSIEIESECGSIVVRVAGPSVELLETRPDPGFRAEIGSSDPEVEVSLEGDGQECEIHAKIEDGGLVTSGSVPRPD